jgi:hypothetical protein
LIWINFSGEGNLKQGLLDYFKPGGLPIPPAKQCAGGGFVISSLGEDERIFGEGCLKTDRLKPGGIAFVAGLS